MNPQDEIARLESAFDQQECYYLEHRSEISALAFKDPKEWTEELDAPRIKACLNFLALYLCIKEARKILEEKENENL